MLKLKRRRKMFDKILVPLDGSKLAEGVIPFVEEIILGARESRKIEITILQVIPSKNYYVPVTSAWLPAATTVKVPYSAAELEQVTKLILPYLEKIGTVLQKDPNVTVKTLVKVGDDAADQILKASDELKIDLIAISTHGRSGISRWAYGSVADRILRGGTIPVLMVRTAEKVG
jgi:nucleotide-binding universal stress UspA family protein